MTSMLTITALTLGLLAQPAAAHAADEPPHTLVLEDGAIQIRDYASMIMAEIEVSGDMARAGNAGFRPLANYIFGGNQARTGGSDEIAMTAPVTQSMSGNDSWRVAFVMPAQWTMESLPTPEDPNVTLSERPARRMAAIRFSGGPNADRFAAKSEELRAWLSAQDYQIIGEPVYARYDPPWIPTIFRRNEVMLEIAR